AFEPRPDRPAISGVGEQHPRRVLEVVETVVAEALEQIGREIGERQPGAAERQRGAGLPADLLQIAAGIEAAAGGELSIAKHVEYIVHGAERRLHLGVPQRRLGAETLPAAIGAVAGLRRGRRANVPAAATAVPTATAV